MKYKQWIIIFGLIVLFNVSCKNDTTKIFDQFENTTSNVIENANLICILHGNKRITDLKLVEGLGIVKNVIIDDEGFVKFNTELIKEIVYKRNFAFIGLIYQSAVLIKDNEATAYSKVFQIQQVVF